MTSRLASSVIFLKMADDSFRVYDRREFKLIMCSFVDRKVAEIAVQRANDDAAASETAQKDRRLEWTLNFERNRGEGRMLKTRYKAPKSCELPAKRKLWK